MGDQSRATSIERMLNVPTLSLVETVRLVVEVAGVTEKTLAQANRGGYWVDAHLMGWLVAALEREASPRTDV